MCSSSTRERLLSIVDDTELICRRLIESLTAPKQQKLDPGECVDLAKLLVLRDMELKETLELAVEQGKIEEEIKQMELQVQKQDESIRKLQQQFKGAESVLSASIFQTKQKLQSIEKALAHPVQSEELIKYAHCISASNAVCAPLNWQQGDPRRPYPTALEMQLGFVGKTESAKQPQHVAQHPRGHGRSPVASSSGLMTAPPMKPAPGMTSAGGPDFQLFSSQPNSNVSPRLPPSTQQQHQHGQFVWQRSDVGMHVKDASHASNETGNKNSQEDFEVMSTDSSSSSSSDSN